MEKIEGKLIFQYIHITIQLHHMPIQMHLAQEALNSAKLGHKYLEMDLQDAHYEVWTNNMEKE